MLAAIRPCKNCGSSNYAEGQIDQASFKVKLPFARFVFSDRLAIHAMACVNCGDIALLVDPEQLTDILGPDST